MKRSVLISLSLSSVALPWASGFQCAPPSSVKTLIVRPAAAAASARSRGERRGALHVDRHHRPSPADLVGQDRHQRGGLAGAAGAEDQSVRGELVVGEPDDPAARVGRRARRRRCAGARGAAGGAATTARRGAPRRRPSPRPAPAPARWAAGPARGTRPGASIGASAARSWRRPPCARVERGAGDRARLRGSAPRPRAARGCAPAKPHALYVNPRGHAQPARRRR